MYSRLDRVEVHWQQKHLTFIDEFVCFLFRLSLIIILFLCKKNENKVNVDVLFAYLRQGEKITKVNAAVISFLAHTHTYEQCRRCQFVCVFFFNFCANIVVRIDNTNEN